MSIEKVVAALNAAFAADPGAMRALMINRVPCNMALANDPYVVCEEDRNLAGDHFSVGTLGVINGVLAAVGMPLVADKWDMREDGPNVFSGFIAYIKPESACSDVLAAPPEPDQYWQHKTSGDRVYFIGRTPEGTMVWQCEGDNVEVGDLDWYEWEYLPGCTGWDWKQEPVPGVPEYPKYWDTDGPTFAYIVQTSRNAFKVIKKDGSEIEGGWWIESDERHRKQLTPQEVLAIERSNVLARATGFKYPQWYVPVKSTISHEHGVRIAYLRRDSDKSGETFLVNGLSFKFYSIGFKPEELYVVTEDEAKSHVTAYPAFYVNPYWTESIGYIVRLSATEAKSVDRITGEQFDYDWNSFNDESVSKGVMLKVTEAEAKSRINQPATDKQFPQYFKDCCGMIFRADSRDRIFWLPMEGGEHLQDDHEYFWNQESTLTPLTEFEIGEIINRSIQAEEKAPSDVMGQSPDDWVPLDEKYDECLLLPGYQFRRCASNTDWRTIGECDSIRGQLIEDERYNVSGDWEFRCLRKDLPVVDARIPVSLYWYDGAIVGRYADSPVTDPSFVPIHSDGNGGWFIERSEDAGN